MALCLPSLECLCERCLKSLPRLPLPLTFACRGIWLCCGTLTWDDPFCGIRDIRIAWTCMSTHDGSGRSDSTCRRLCLRRSAADLADCHHSSHHPALACCALAVAAAPVHCWSDLMHACRPLRLCLKTEVLLNSREIDSRARAISTALAKVNCFASLSFLCVSLSPIPIAKMSRNAWSRKASNSHSAAKSFSSTTKSVTLSVSFCFLV